MRLPASARYLRPFKLYLVVGPLMKTLEVVFDLLTPLVIAWMVDGGIRAGDSSVVARGGGLLLLFAFLGFCSTLVCQKMASLTSQGMGTQVRHDLFEAIGRLSFQDLDAFGTPSLITRITNDVNQLQLAVAMLIRQVIRWPVLAVGSLVCALAIDPLLGSIFCICLPLTLGIFYVVMKKSIPYFASMQQKLDAIGRIVREALDGTRVIRAFSREDFEQARFEAAANDQAQTAVAVGRLSALLNPSTFLVLNGGICLVLFLGAGQVWEGRLEQGQVMALIGYMNQLLVSVAFIANLVVIFTRAAASLKRVDPVLEFEPSVPELATQPVQVHWEAPALRFCDASFAYPGAEKPALSHLSLSLEPGEVLGVIGGTGSGKSTLGNLIPRFYDVQSGAVEVFGANVRDYPFEQLRSLVAVTPQASSLLSGTIRDNLLWRNPQATDEELWAALRAAQAESFVAQKPLGLDEPVDAGGKNFSGGQRQRLCIARALVGQPSLLVLDDAASALDFATDAALRHSLRQLDSAPACVIISQRVASVRQAAKICVLDHGQVAGLGTHEELWESCPLYREICLSQMDAQEVLA